MFSNKRYLLAIFLVDIYGKCGDISNPRQIGLDTEESNSLLSEYRFYIAFENSICHNYVTEKYYRALETNTIPLVLKRSPYDSMDLPNDSYISIEDYGSPRELAMYLNKLMHNNTMYMEYFRWIYGYYPDPPNWHMFRQPNLCGLCETLSKETLGKRVNANVKSWWFEGGKCEDSNYIEKFLNR